MTLLLFSLPFRNCQIQEVHEAAFSKLKILVEVDLSSNNITKLSDKTFEGLKGLQNLYLSNNRIEYLKVRLLHFRCGFLNPSSSIGSSIIFISNWAGIIDQPAFVTFSGIFSLFIFFFPPFFSRRQFHSSFLFRSFSLLV